MMRELTRCLIAVTIVFTGCGGEPETAPVSQHDVAAETPEDIPIEQVVISEDGTVDELVEDGPSLPESVIQVIETLPLDGGLSAYVGEFHPDGTSLAIGLNDGSVRFWRFESQGFDAVLRGPESIIYDVAFSPDGTRIAAAYSTGVVQVWSLDAASDPLVVYTGEHSVNSVDFANDGALLATGDRIGFLKLWDVETGELRQELGRHEDFVSQVEFSPTESLLASVGGDGALRLWDLGTMTSADELRGRPDNAAGDDAPTYLQSLAFDASGELLAAGDWSGNLYLWDVASREQVGNLPGHGGIPFSVDFHPEDRPLLISGDRNDGTLRVWNVDTGQPAGIGEFGSAGDPDGVTFSHVAFSADGERVAAFATWEIFVVDVNRLMEGHSAAAD